MNNFNFASIDVGSNSINLLIAKVVGKKIIFQKTLSYITGLGKGLAETGFFSEEGKKNAKGAFLEIFKIIQDNKIPLENIVCVATEASRVAANSKDFYDEIKKEFFISTQIISAREEAELSLKGVVGGKPDGEYLVLDLGGASTELIYCNDYQIVDFKSFKIGSVNISDEYDKNDVAFFIKKIKFSNKIILVGGTTTTLAASILSVNDIDPEKINKLSLSFLELKKFAKSFSKLNEVDLLNKYPLVSSRISSIQNGVDRLIEILEQVQPEEIIFSVSGVRQGALLKFIE